MRAIEFDTTVCGENWRSGGQNMISFRFRFVRLESTAVNTPAAHRLRLLLTPTLTVRELWLPRRRRLRRHHYETIDGYWERKTFYGKL